MGCIERGREESSTLEGRVNIRGGAEWQQDGIEGAVRKGAYNFPGLFPPLPNSSSQWKYYYIYIYYFADLLSNFSSLPPPLLSFSSSLSADLFPPFFVSSLIEASNFRLRLRARIQRALLCRNLETIGSEGGKGKNERWLARERDGWCREDGRLTDLEARFTRPRPSEKWMARRRYPRHERRQREMARFRGVVGRYGYLTWRWSGVQCREMIREDRMWQVLNLFRRQCKWIRWCAAVGDGTDLCQTRDFRDWIVDGNRGIWKDKVSHRAEFRDMR